MHVDDYAKLVTPWPTVRREQVRTLSLAWGYANRAVKAEVEIINALRDGAKDRLAIDRGFGAALRDTAKALGLLGSNASKTIVEHMREASGEPEALTHLGPLEQATEQARLARELTLEGMEGLVPKKGMRPDDERASAMKRLQQAAVALVIARDKTFRLAAGVDDDDDD